MEAFLAEQAGVALAAGRACGPRVVATAGERVIDAEGDAAGDDLRFGQRDERRVDREPLAAFDAGLGGEVGHLLKSGDVFGAAIGVAGVVERVDAEEDVARAEDLDPGEREGEKDGVARGNVGNRDAVRDFIALLGPWGRGYLP